MTVRFVATLLLGAAAIIASPAISQPAGSSHSTPAKSTPDRSAWPPTLRAAIEAADTKCLGQGGKPGISPDLVKMLPRGGVPVYVLDLNAYECRGTKPADGPAAVTLFSADTGRFPVRLPSGARRPPVAPGDVAQIFTTRAYASRIVAQPSVIFLSISEIRDCGRPDAANILLRRWEWCSRRVVGDNYSGSYFLLAAPSLSNPGTSAWTAGNYPQAAQLWTAAIDLGDAQSMVNLAGMVAEGKAGVPQDEARAVALYRRAAETPPPAPAAPVQPTLGSMLRFSMPEALVQPDPDNAANVLAMLRLALAYEEGHGVSRDKAQAAVWFRRWAGTTVNPVLRAQRVRTLADHNIQP